MKTAKEISELLAKNIDEVVNYLLPNGERKGHEWQVGSLQGESGGSLRVHLNGTKAGIWCDFASNEKGDILDLWANVRKISLLDAIKEASKWLGIVEVQLTGSKPKKWQRPALSGFPISLNSNVANYLSEERRLTLDTMVKFGLYNNIENGKDEIVFRFIKNKELVLAKYLAIDRTPSASGKPKKIIRVSKDCEPILFGWQALNPQTRTVAITEGELDAMSLDQYGIPALSIPFGVNNDKWIEQDFEQLAVFDEIYICMDNDEEGQKAAKIFAERLGLHRCKIVTLPYKDANECLQNNISAEEIQKCFKNAASFDPEEIIGFDKFSEIVKQKLYSPVAEQGYEILLEKARGKILFRPGDLSVWSGINGHGKSVFLGQVSLDMIKQGAKICVASLEMPAQNLLTRLVKQASGMAMPSPEYIDAIHEWYQGKAWLFNLVGTAKRERLLDVFLYMKRRYNVDVFFIDSLLKCGLAEDDYNGQKLFVEQLCDFKNEHMVHIHLVAHPRKPEDEYTISGKLDIRGSSSISDLADNVFSIFRNKKKEEEIDKYTQQGKLVSNVISGEYDTLLCCSKQRNGEWEKAIALWYDKQSLQFLNSQMQKPRQYVQYSRSSF